MSSLAKVHLFTELGLLPLKRYIQRKPDHYQQATKEYSAKLRELYQLSLKDRRQAQRAQKQAIESETFRFNCEFSELNGITIDKESLPGAELNDRIVLISQDETSEDKILARGVIINITNQKIRIKFEEPIFKQPKAPPAGVEPKKELEASKRNEPIETKEEHTEVVTSQTDENHQTEKSSMLDFKIKFDLKKGHKNEIEDSHSKLVETTLLHFEKLKCNQAMQRDLLGFYDERSDTLNDKARVMTFGELVHKLNSQQQLAIEHALKRRLTLIEGPAGTGKTVVAAHIATNVARQKKGRVLVRSLIPETIDKLAELIDRVGGFQVVKLPTTLTSGQSTPPTGSLVNEGSKRSRNGYFSSETKQCNHCHLDKLVDDEIYLQAYSRFKETLGNNPDKLHAHAYRMVTGCSEIRRRELETKIISKASVVCCQINQTTSYLLKGIEFDMLILDDVNVTSELDCLIAIMTKGIKQVVLLSDTRRDVRLSRILKKSQSMPHSDNQTNAKRQVLKTNQTSNSPRRKRQDTTMGRSCQISTMSDNVTLQSQKSGISSIDPSLEPGNLFERLLSLSLPTVDLRIQYRCHANLSNFFIYHFYAGRLKNDPETNDEMSTEIADRLMVDDNSFSWLPNKKYLTAIYKVPSCSDLVDAANTLQRTSERFKIIEDKVEELIDVLLSNEDIRKCGYNVGIIYNNQIQARLSQRSNQADIKRGTIDRFIGQENDFTVLVASGNHCSAQSDRTYFGISSSIPCDFTRSDTVLSWALTRARLGLFIVLEDNRCMNSGETHNDDLTLPQHEDCKSWRELIKYYAANDLIVG